MEIKTIDAAQLSKMFLAGAKSLEKEKDYINELNVFPVPDGDTGTNMTMTIMSAAKEVYALDNPDMKTLSKAISSGSLRGARGNSGVILSQLFRGFTKVIKTVDEIDVDIMCEAIQKSCETAYKAVMKPKEGTILTVARGVADKALELVDTTDDLAYFCDEIIKEGNLVLSKTPDMLPVLKQAGVVDSGGQGLMQVLMGGFDYMMGKEVDLSFDDDAKAEEVSVEEVKYEYSVEYVITMSCPISTKKKNDLVNYLGTVGDSVEVKAENNRVMTSVNTNEPGAVINMGMGIGSLVDIKIENLKVSGEDASAPKAAENNSVEPAPVETTNEITKEIGFVAVSIGEGLNAIFTELGVDQMIEGGQTMNPSTEDVLDAINKVPAKTVFVLPNNKNIIMAANQAALLSEDKEVKVIPTKTIPQGITALINFIPDESPEDNEKRMLAEIANVKTGQITYAVRDTVIDDKEIKMGDYMGIGDAGILSVSQDITDTFIDMLKEMVDEESAIISIYYGADVSEDDATALSEKIGAEFGDVEIELQQGGQPVYYYICAVE
ncbi:MAG: DAK2 domain-containing protein [Lachnospiraceae bacterium]|nr:DAK2 domain-containing protein [Lachnospiraceae bacterium]